MDNLKGWNLKQTDQTRNFGFERQTICRNLISGEFFNENWQSCSKEEQSQPGELKQF